MPPLPLVVPVMPLGEGLPHAGLSSILRRRFREREAIFALDDGMAPPLCPLGPPAGAWGRLLGTEALDPSGLAAWKATAVRFLPIIIVLHLSHLSRGPQSLCLGTEALDTSGLATCKGTTVRIPFCHRLHSYISPRVHRLCTPALRLCIDAVDIASRRPDVPSRTSWACRSGGTVSTLSTKRLEHP